MQNQAAVSTSACKCGWFISSEPRSNVPNSRILGEAAPHGGETAHCTVCRFVRVHQQNCEPIDPFPSAVTFAFTNFLLNSSKPQSQCPDWMRYAMTSQVWRSLGQGGFSVPLPRTLCADNACVGVLASTATGHPPCAWGKDQTPRNLPL